MKRLLGLTSIMAITAAVWTGNNLWLRTPQAERVTDVAAALLNGREATATAFGRPEAQQDLAPWYGGFFIGVAGLLLLGSLARDTVSKWR